jgi:hypothetical protein
MPLPGTIQPAPDGALGFDADTPISTAVAGQFFAQGYKFCLRYVSLGRGRSKGDLSAAEARRILASGLGLMPVQHVRGSPWAPTAALGNTDGTNAAANATAVGFPPGVSLWFDLEDVEIGAAVADVTAHCNAWYDAAFAAGYIPGIYVGANAVLDGEQLYSLKFQHYWKSMSRVPVLPERGYQMVQSLVPESVNGIGIDRDVTHTDEKGGQALWLIAK